MSAITLRRMTRADLPQVLEIEQASFTAPFTEKMFLQELALPMARAIVAVPGETDAAVLGYIDWWHVYDEIHVINVAVRSADQRRGIGTDLVAEMLTEGRQKRARFAYLEVRKTNTAAQALYEKFGFRRYGERRGYYHDNNEDAVLMGLEL